MKNKKSVIFKALTSFALLLAICFSGALVFHSYYYDPVYISGNSMNPTLVGADENALNDDEVDLNKITADFGIVDSHQSAIKHIKRFDIISTYFPTSEDYYMDGSIKADANKKIKRVIGLPGETIKIEKGLLYVLKNDQYELIKYTFKVNPSVETEYTGKDMEPLKLNDDEYWVLGDNRQASHDSAAVGAIRYKNICGVLVALEGKGQLYVKRWTCDHCGKNFYYEKDSSNICPNCNQFLRRVYDIKNKHYHWPKYF